MTKSFSVAPGIEEEAVLRIFDVWKAVDARLVTLAEAARLNPKVDFRRRDFRGWPLFGQDVRGIDFSFCDLRGTGIEFANQDGTSILDGAIFDPPPNFHKAAFSSERSSSFHVGILGDGAGRWASKRGLPRAEGHRRGVE